MKKCRSVHPYLVDSQSGESAESPGSAAWNHSGSIGCPDEAADSCLVLLVQRCAARMWAFNGGIKIRLWVFIDSLSRDTAPVAVRTVIPNFGQLGQQLVEDMEKLLYHTMC